MHVWNRTKKYLKKTNECINDIFINYYIPSKVVDHIISFQNICDHCNKIIRIGFQSTIYCNYCNSKVCENCFRLSNINYVGFAHCGLNVCQICSITKFTKLPGWKHYHCLRCVNEGNNSINNYDY